MFQAKEGDNLLDVVINNDLDIDGFGACEGTLACSTCHLVFTEKVNISRRPSLNIIVIFPAGL